MNLAFADIHVLRPAWLFALALLPVLAWAWRRRAQRRSAWRSAVDPHLLPHLLEQGGGRGAGGRLEGMAVLGGLALAILALAGPSWRTVPQPLQARGGALVVALDLSSSVQASDLQPSRLVQARARIGELLQASGGDVALVAYAEDAFVVSPLTPDAANVTVFLDALAPDIMPVDGQRPERAIRLAGELLEQAGHARGDILLLAAGVNQAAVGAAAEAVADGHRVSVLAMGTAAGAGYRDREGNIHRSALDAPMLAALAAGGGGRVHDWSEPPAQLAAALGAGQGVDSGAGTASGAGLVREDGGFWLLPPALFLLLFAFRRGGVLAALALCLLLPQPPVFAAGQEGVEGSAWRRADQAAHARSVEAEQAYREEDFATAERGFAGLPGADAAYNRGNALARAGRYEEAIAAYDEALAAEPGMADALANRAAVEAAMRRGPPPPGGSRGNDMPPEGGEDGRGAGSSDSGQGDDGRSPPDDGAGRSPEGDEDSPTEPPEGQDDAGQEPPASADADPGDDADQQAADEAQREAMQRALEEGVTDADGEEAGDQRPASASPEEIAAEERERANAAWLRRVPDDPGALLRARFRNEHLRRRGGER